MPDNSPDDLPEESDNSDRPSPAPRRRSPRIRWIIGGSAVVVIAMVVIVVVALLPAGKPAIPVPEAASAPVRCRINTPAAAWTNLTRGVHALLPVVFPGMPNAQAEVLGWFARCQHLGQPPNDATRGYTRLRYLLLCGAATRGSVAVASGTVTRWGSVFRISAVQPDESP